MHAIKYKRTNKSQKNVIGEKRRRVEEEEEKLQTFMPDLSRKFRFQRPTEVLKNLNINFQGKMEELRLLPIVHDEEEIGSFFFDELETSHLSESSKRFYVLYLELVDLCQNLPLVLVNKRKICEVLLSKFGDEYYDPIIGRLLVQLYRDCGGELYQETVELVIPRLMEALDIVKVE